MAPVLHRIIDDLVIAATEDIRGEDPAGRPIRIFIDTVATIGNLPQAAAFTDVLGDSENILCMIC